MSKLTKILLIAIIFIITIFGIMVRKYLGIPIVIKNLILLMIVIPLVKFIWNIPSSKSSQNVFSDTKNYQQPFNQWQNNASPQQGDFVEVIRHLKLYYNNREVFITEGIMQDTSRHRDLILLYSNHNHHRNSLQEKIMGETLMVIYMGKVNRDL